MNVPAPSSTHINKTLVKPIYTCGENLAVLYEGSKNLWRWRQNVDIIIVSHKLFQILEVVCLIPRAIKEVSRVYLSHQVLEKRLNKEEIEEKIQSRKEFLLRQNKSVVLQAIADKVVEDLKVAYILARVDLLEEGPGFQVNIIERNCDGSISDAEFVCAKPEQLNPLELRNHQDNNVAVPPTEFKTTLEKFRLEYKAVHSQNLKAIKALHCDEDFEVIQEKSVPKERWIRAIGTVLFRITLFKIKIRLMTFQEKKQGGKMTRRPPHRVHTIDSRISEHFNKAKDGHDDHHHRHHHNAKLPSIPMAGSADDNDYYRPSDFELWAQEEIKSGHRSKRGLGLFHGQHKENLADHHYHHPSLHPHHNVDHPDHTHHTHHDHHHHQQQHHDEHGQNYSHRYRSLPHLHVHGEVPSEGRDSARSQNHHQHHHQQHHNNHHHHHHNSVLAPVSLFPKKPDALVPHEDERERYHDHSETSHLNRHDEKLT